MKKITFCILILFLPLGLKLYSLKDFPTTPKAVFTDEDENVYFVLENEKNIAIAKTSPEGEFTGKWSTPRYYGYNCVFLYNLVFSEEGKALCTLVLIDSRNLSPISQIQYEIDFSREKQTLIYEKEAKESNEFENIINSKNNNSVLCDNKTSIDIYSGNEKFKAALQVGMRYDEILFAGLAGFFPAEIIYLIFRLIEKNKLTVSLLFKQAMLMLVIFGFGIFIIISKITQMFEETHELKTIYALEKAAYKALDSLENGELLSDYYYDEINLLRVLPGNEFLEVTLNEKHRIELMQKEEAELNVSGYSENDTSPLIYENELWLSVSVPVLGSCEKSGEFIEASVMKRSYIYETEQIISEILVYISAFTGAIAVLILAGLVRPIRSLRKLKRTLAASEKGEYNTVKAKGNDEVAGITSAFNTIIKQTKSNINNLTELNNAYIRFLPSELLKKLGRSSALAVKQGDHASIETYILYISVINFIQVTENMGDNEVFEFFNRICEDVLLIVMSWGGLVESYNHSEFICLFEREDGVLEAAKAINTRLSALNKVAVSKLKTVISLTRGDALIGVVGYDERLGTLTLSGAVTLARHITRIGNLYGSDIIYPDGIINPDSYRKLGTYTFDNEQILLFDCFEDKEDDIFFNRKRLAPLFEQGVSTFENEEWKESKLIFIKYLRESIPDPAAKQYLYLCEHNINYPDNPLRFGYVVSADKVH